MADIVPDSPRPAPPGEPVAQKRSHSYSRLTTAIAVLGLATASYALLRLDATRDRVDQVNDIARQSLADREALRAQLAALTDQQRQQQAAVARQLEALGDIPRQIQQLDTSVGELQGKSAGPQRAWSRAEAAYLMEIAQRSLTLHRDVETAIAALQSADTRLASLRDPGVTAVRQQLAREVQALRGVQMPDITGIVARLSGIEEQAGRAIVNGIAIERSSDSSRVLPQDLVARAQAVAMHAIASLISIRKVDDRAGNIVTLDEELVRRQYLQLLLFTARSAVARHDEPTYRSALAGARRWLGDSFDLTAPVNQTILHDIQALEPLRIDPALPGVAASLRLLQQTAPGAGAAD